MPACRRVASLADSAIAAARFGFSAARLGRNKRGCLSKAASTSSGRSRPGVTRTPDRHGAAVIATPDPLLHDQPADRFEKQGAGGGSIGLGKTRQEVSDGDVWVLASTSGEIGEATEVGQGSQALLFPRGAETGGARGRCGNPRWDGGRRSAPIP